MIIITVRTTCLHVQMIYLTTSSHKTKMFRHIQNSDDQKKYSRTTSPDYRPGLIIEKCKLLPIGKRTPSFKYTMYTDDLTTISLARVQTEKEAGVTFDEDMTFRHDITLRATKANNIMGIIRRNYTYLEMTSFKLLFKSLVRPHLEYGDPVWNPGLKRDIAELKKFERRATKQIPALKNMSYPDRLRKLSLPTLPFRRLRGDMIETYKSLKGIIDISLPALITPVKHRETRGHHLKLPKDRAETTIKAHLFTHRIVNDWNSLPEQAISAPSVNAFKNRLDAHWKHHPWMYHWKAVLGPSTSTPTLTGNTKK